MLWDALDIEDPPSLRPCSEGSANQRECSAELITVMDPFQVIVALRRHTHVDEIEAEVFLRFLRPSGPEGSGPWEFAGSYQPPVKYFAPKHIVIRFGSKPFLLVTRQGAAGTGLSSEVEDWLDLAAETFSQVFSLTTKGDLWGGGDRINLETRAYALEKVESEPVETIHVSYLASFIQGELEIGQRSNEVFYVRRDGKFVIDPVRSNTSEKDIEAIFDNYPGGLGSENERYLRVLLPELKEIAAHPKHGQHAWLRRYLTLCKDTPEKREIQKAFRASLRR